MDKLLESMTALLGKQDENMLPLIEQLINAARSEGWNHRDQETGTKYQIGWWGDSDDEYNLEDGDDPDVHWHNQRNAHSRQDAADTAYRWGCDWRAIRHNPFATET